MKAATFHNAMVTVVSAYAEALDEMQRELADLQTQVALMRKASLTTPKLEAAARAVHTAYEQSGRGFDDARPAVREAFEDLRHALDDLDALRGGRA